MLSVGSCWSHKHGAVTAIRLSQTSRWDCRSRTSRDEVGRQPPTPSQYRDHRIDCQLVHRVARLVASSFYSSQFRHRYRVVAVVSDGSRTLCRRLMLSKQLPCHRTCPRGLQSVMVDRHRQHQRFKIVLASTQTVTGVTRHNRSRSDPTRLPRVRRG